jgi:uncharacterized protein (DUF2147 family)
MLGLDFMSLLKAGSKAAAGAALITGAMMATGLAQNTGEIAGTWIDHTGRGAVEIHPCGDRLCGRIAWLKEPQVRGAPAKDAKGRPLCGLQIIGDLKPQRNGAWEDGWIYNPEEGQTFNVEITLQSRDTLKVTGYMGIKLLSEDFIWKRASEKLASCNMARPS